MRLTKSLLIAAGVVAVAGLVAWQWSPGPSNPFTESSAATGKDIPGTAIDAPLAEAPAAVEAVPPASGAPVPPASARQRSAPRTSSKPAALKTVVAEAAPPARAAEDDVPTAAYEQRVADAARLADEDEAFAALRQLSASEPGRPEAFEAMAGISLRNHQYDQARDALRQALAHGGKATFALLHDHIRGNFEKDNPAATCVGDLTIAGSEVRFSSRESDDGFVATWADVRSTGSNKFFGSGIGGFHVTLTQNGKYKNFNLAPRSRDKAEGKLILDLLEASARQAADREQ